MPARPTTFHNPVVPGFRSSRLRTPPVDLSASSRISRSVATRLIYPWKEVGELRQLVARVSAQKAAADPDPSNPRVVGRLEHAQVVAQVLVLVRRVGLQRLGVDPHRAGFSRLWTSCCQEPCASAERMRLVAGRSPAPQRLGAARERTPRFETVASTTRLRKVDRGRHAGASPSSGSLAAVCSTEIWATPALCSASSAERMSISAHVTDFSSRLARVRPRGCESVTA